MSRRALLFDVGNARVKWGVVEGEEIIHNGSLDHAELRRVGFDVLLRHLPKDVDYALASNVAGQDFGARLARAVGIHIGGDLHFARSESEHYGLRSGYSQPRQLGVDRWAAMIGARAEFDGALCVVDAGSALTMDAIDADGQHLGGQIMPGLRLLADSLANETSGIAASSFDPGTTTEPFNWFASTTAEAVAAGALNVLCGAIERSVSQLHEAGLSPELVLTGGDASRILEALGGTAHLRPNLVLTGLMHMLPAKSE